MEFSVSDQTGAAVLVVFDEEMAKITNTKLLKLRILWYTLLLKTDY